MGGSQHPNFLLWVRVVLRGVGQIVFQDHAVTGLLFLAGVAVASPVMAIGGLLGACIGPALARLLKYDQQEIESGIYGYNSTLVGIGLLFYLVAGSVATWALVVLGSVASVFVTRLMRRYWVLPAYTAPFVICTWVMLLIALGLAVPKAPHGEGPQKFQLTLATFAEVVLAGDAEIMFGANDFTGVLFVAGIAVSNWRHAVLFFLGSLMGTLTGIYHHDPEEAIGLGIYGYNASLAAVAVDLWRKSLLYPILAAIISVPLIEFFPDVLNIPPLTAPFVVAAWIVIVVGRLEKWFCTD
jgi:urea transporter